MAEYIDRDIVLAHKGDCYDYDGHLLYAVGTGDILRIPAADVVERKKGEWIDKEIVTYLLNGERYATAYGYYCSNCGKTVGEKGNFCPSCGSDMRKEVTDG